MNRVRAVEIHEKSGDPTENVKDFPTVEAAAKWAAEIKGKPLIWDTDRYGITGMTPEEEQAITDGGEYPERYFCLVGIDEDGNDDEIDESHYENYEKVLEMKLRLYPWDELGNEIECWDQTNPDAAREENMGWEYDKLLPNGVVVLCTDRHYALETWAKDKDEANEKFMAFELYREYQDGME